MVGPRGNVCVAQALGHRFRGPTAGAVHDAGAALVGRDEAPDLVGGLGRVGHHGFRLGGRRESGELRELDYAGGRCGRGEDEAVDSATVYDRAISGVHLVAEGSVHVLGKTAIPVPGDGSRTSKRRADLRQIRLSPDRNRSCSIDRDIPKRSRGTTTVTFTPQEAGRYVFECSQLCGAGHAFMRGEIVVTDATRSGQ